MIEWVPITSVSEDFAERNEHLRREVEARIINAFRIPKELLNGPPASGVAHLERQMDLLRKPRR